MIDVAVVADIPDFSWLTCGVDRIAGERVPDLGLPSQSDRNGRRRAGGEDGRCACVQPMLV